MEEIKNFISRWCGFSFCVLMCFLMVGALIGSAVSIKATAFIGVCGVIGSILGLFIFAVQAYLDWKDGGA